MNQRIDMYKNMLETVNNFKESIKQTIYERYNIPYTLNDKMKYEKDLSKIDRKDQRLIEAQAATKVISKIFISALEKRQKFQIDPIKDKILIRVNGLEVYRK